ncbi:MAG: hypothetical protein Kow0081_1340 [Candidatus Dojkabacteria bacterium]
MKKVFIITTIVVGIVASVALVFFYVFSRDDAGKPFNLRVSSITSNSAIITWQTEKEIIGKVAFNKTNEWPFLEKYFGDYAIAHDDRNLELIVLQETAESPQKYVYTYKDDIAEKRRHHFVTLRDLEPETEYFVRIVGNYSLKDSLSFSTFPLSDVVPEVPDPAYGDVDNFESSELDPTSGFVLYQFYPKNEDSGLKKSQFYAALINKESKWSGDFSTILDEEGNILDWNSDDYKIFVDGYTPVGDGTGYFSLDDYKPLPDLVVNVRYIQSQV